MIPLFKPSITELEKKYVSDALDAPQLTNGPLCRKFEEKVATIHGYNDCVAVSNGTVALELAIRSKFWGQESVVIQKIGYISLINALESLDIDYRFDRGDHDISVELWYPTSLTSKLVDGCQHFGSNFGGRMTCLSFCQNKAVTTGEGGAILTNSPQEATVLRGLRDQVIGNYRMSEINAALGLAQIERWPEIKEKRQRIKDKYTNKIKGIEFSGYFSAIVTKRPDRTKIYARNLGDYDLNGEHSYLSNWWMIPLFTDMTDQDIETVIRAVNDASV